LPAVGFDDIGIESQAKFGSQGIEIRSVMAISELETQQREAPPCSDPAYDALNRVVADLRLRLPPRRARDCEKQSLVDTQMLVGKLPRLRGTYSAHSPKTPKIAPVFPFATKVPRRVLSRLPASFPPGPTTRGSVTMTRAPSEPPPWRNPTRLLGTYLSKTICLIFFTWYGSGFGSIPQARPLGGTHGRTRWTKVDAADDLTVPAFQEKSPVRACLFVLFGLTGRRPTTVLVDIFS
jgi:hypothetical protein